MAAHTRAGDLQPVRTRQWMRQVRFRVAAVDAVAIYVALFTAHLLRFGIGEAGWLSEFDWFVEPATYSARFAWVALGLFAAWLIALALSNAWDTRLMGAGTQEYSRIVNASLAFFGALAIFAYAARWQLARGYVAIALPLGILLLCLGRWAMRQLLIRDRRAGMNLRRTLLVGTSDGVAQVAHELRRVPSAGYQVVGACMDRTSQPAAGITTIETPAPVTGRIAVQVKLLGPVADAVAYVAEHPIDTVIVSGGGSLTPSALNRLAWDMEPYVADVMVAPGLADVAGPRVSARPVGGLPLMQLEPPGHASAQLRLKRAADVLGSLGLILLFSPLLAVVALLVKVTSPGPVLFRQTRIGEGGVPFEMLKFRSMVANAEAQLEQVLDGEVGLFYKPKNDPRITPIGKFLRRYSIDELPQLFNVLFGTMSLVGPRPQIPAEVELYDHTIERRLFVKPGMTGLWQVSGRSDLSIEDSLRLDLYYATNWSVGTDVVILLKTARAVLGRDGAY